MKTYRIGICGYGNLGRGVLLALRQQLIGHSVYHGDTSIGVIERSLYDLQVAARAPQRPHGIHLARGVCPYILRQATRACSPLNILPDGLSCAVPSPVPRARKRPEGRNTARRCLPDIPPLMLGDILRSIGGNRVDELLRQPDVPPLAGLPLRKPGLLTEGKSHPQYITDP